jgi:hypothetical protein
VHEVLHVQGESLHEVVVRDVDEVVLGRTRHRRRDGRRNLRIRARPARLARRPRHHDAGEHERGQVQPVAPPQLHAEVRAGELADRVGDPLARGVGLAVRGLEGVALRHAVGGDRPVQHDVGGGELVHEEPEPPELCDEIGLERPERAGRDREGVGRAAQGRQVERAVVHLVVHEAADEAAPGQLRSRQPQARALPLEREPRPRGPRTGPAQQRAHAPQVGLERGRAHVQAVGGVEHVDALVGVEQRAHDRVQPLPRGARLGVGVQRGGGARQSAVAGGTRLDGVAAGHARVHRGDVRAHAARRDAELVGQRRRGHPVAAAQQDAEHPILPSPGHVRLSRPLVQSITRRRGPILRAEPIFRTGGKNAGCSAPSRPRRIDRKGKLEIDEDPCGVRRRRVQHVRRPSHPSRRPGRGTRARRVRRHRALAADRPRLRRRRAARPAPASLAR